MLLKDYFRFRVAIINIAITPDNAIPFTYCLAEQIRSPVSAISYFSLNFFFKTSKFRCPRRFGPPSSDLDPTTKLSENIILIVLVEIDNTLCSSAY